MDDEFYESAPATTGLGFAAWLVAALERRLPEDQVPGELWLDEGAAAPERGPRDEA